MAYRYSKTRPVADEALDPRDWNLNMKELADEFNGYLDRDNIPEESISLSMVEAETFAKIHCDSIGSTTIITGDTTGWVDGGATDIGKIEEFFPFDCTLVIEWSGTYEWNTAVGTDTAAEFRILVDGEEVAATGPNLAFYLEGSSYIPGVAQVLAGSHTIKVQARINQYLKFKESFLRAVSGGVVSNLDIKERELIVVERRC
jgi:hypothetical protein